MVSKHAVANYTRQVAQSLGCRLPLITFSSNPKLQIARIKYHLFDKPQVIVYSDSILYLPTDVIKGIVGMYVGRCAGKAFINKIHIATYISYPVIILMLLSALFHFFLPHEILWIVLLVIYLVVVCFLSSVSINRANMTGALVVGKDAEIKALEMMMPHSNMVLNHIGHIKNKDIANIIDIVKISSPTKQIQQLRNN